MDEGSGAGEAGAGTQEKRGARQRVSGGIRQGLGVLSALKDALEESISEAKERGDLSPERAREVVKSAIARAQEAAGDARERLDLVSRKDVEELRQQVEALKARVQSLERGEQATGLEGSG